MADEDFGKRQPYAFLEEVSLIGEGLPGLEIKKIFRSPFGDQPEKYSRQIQIFSRQFVKCK